MNIFELGNLEQFASLRLEVAEALLGAEAVETGTWQATTDHPEMLRTFELAHTRIDLCIDTPYQPKLAICTGANMPWAEDHFLERVSGEPLNPPPSETYWPYARQNNAEHKADQVFSHTYPERFWPVFANMGGRCADSAREIAVPIVGIRYEYGSLADVINLLKRDPQTRQAYLPVWFPEDTGAHAGQRVPCTLGYHFLCRNGMMDITYHIRSCDFMRHWRDDVYLAGRLLQWVCAEVGVKPRKLIMNIGSLHIFQNDRPVLQSEVREAIKQINQDRYQRIASAL